MKIQVYQTCVNKDLHVHQIPDTLIMEYKNSLQYNDIRGIDLSIDYSCQLLFTKEPENHQIEKRKKVNGMATIWYI